MFKDQEENRMKSRVQQAVEKKNTGYNCAQAVACTYCDLAGVDEETMKNITQAFAGGMGTMEASCGALTGAAIALGMINKNPVKSMQNVRAIMSAFKEQNGTVICKELKGIATGKIVRACSDCVYDAALFLEQQLGGFED